MYALKNAGMPESKYGTHSSDQCHDTREAMIQMASDSLLLVRDQKTVLDCYKKRYKENNRELKKVQKCNAKLFEAAKKYMERNEFKKMMTKKLARHTEASIINVSKKNSNSDDDSSVPVSSTNSSSDSE